MQGRAGAHLAVGEIKAVTITQVARFDAAHSCGLDAVDHDETSAYTSSENMRSSSLEDIEEGPCSTSNEAQPL